jgi:hypothetical protein
MATKRKRQHTGRASDPYDVLPTLNHGRRNDPIPEEYSDPRFITLDVATCMQLVRLYETDIDIQTFATASMNHALAGGIMFTRKNKKLEEESADWHNQVWGRWVRDVQKMLFSVGFCIASFVRHHKYGAEPTVLSLEHIDIKYHLDLNGIPHFRAWEKLEATDMVMIEGQMFTRREIHSFKVWWIAPPTRDGTIKSQLTTLIADLTYEQHLLRVAFVADRQRACPPIVSQYVQQPYKATNVTIPAAAQASQTPRLGDGSKPYQMHQLVDLMNSYTADDIDSLSGRMHSILDAKINNSSSEQVYLKDGRELVKQIMPEAPHDILLGFRQSRMVRVALCFGLTLPSLTHTPSKMSTGGDVKKGGTKGADDDGSRSVYFENYQRELKQRIITYIHQMYNYIHAAPFAIETIRSARQPIDVHELKESVMVTVSLPGQPEENVLYKLYTDGVLKYEAFVNYVSAKHSIPLDAFETTPKLDLKLLRGIEPPPPKPPAK